MKIVLLLVAFLFSVGFSIKQVASDKKQLSARQELNAYKSQPNLLPVVEVVANRG